MRRRPKAHGSTLTEAAVVLAALGVLLAISVPVIGGLRSDAGLEQSMSNLVTMSIAHVVYAADWEGRQVTWCREDLGLYGDFLEYNAAHDCPGSSDPFDPNCHPPIIAGYGESFEDSGFYVIWAYWSHQSNRAVMAPINFPGGPFSGAADGWGHWRFQNARPFHEYLTGRWHDAIFYAPKDTAILANLEECIGEFGEFVSYPQECNPGWSSYCRSAAALFHPDVMRSNAAGGWQNPWGLAQGFEVPGLFQATYPDLKTHVMEHSWLQDPPAECNPAFFGCEPYYFNHGFDSTPAALFYDGSVRLLPNEEVLFADFQVLSESDGVDGLWHRGTPFGYNGYFIADGWDFVPLSHHVLTTDGILGRDTLNGVAPAPLALSWKRPESTSRPAGHPATAPNAQAPIPLTAEGGEP
jgi:hypothetical protein